MNALQAPRVLARILGVDPGTRTVGYGLVDPRPGTRGRIPFAYVECGVIQCPTDAEVPQRLGVVGEALAEIIAEFSPAAVAIEKAYHGRNALSALLLGQARGAIMLVAMQHHLPVFEYAPAKIKRVVTGSGRATKQQMQDRVQLLLGMRSTPAVDAADALAIALCHGQTGDRG